MPDQRTTSDGFARCIRTLSDSGLVIIAADRYSIELQALDEPFAWTSELTELAKEAVDLQMLQRIARELTAAQAEFGSLCARQSFDRITVEELQSMTDAHTRFWQAKEAYESVSVLLTTHFRHVRALATT